jgi:hypothetical protein
MPEIKIGILETPKEITIELDGTAEEIARNINDAIAKASGLIWLTDAKGKQVGIPIAKLAYIEIEADRSMHAVGFGN